MPDDGWGNHFLACFASQAYINLAIALYCSYTYFHTDIMSQRDALRPQNMPGSAVTGAPRSEANFKFAWFESTLAMAKDRYHPEINSQQNWSAGKWARCLTRFRCAHSMAMRLVKHNRISGDSLDRHFCAHRDGLEG